MGKYHMHKMDREITDKNELARILKSGKYAVIAMCRNNEPYIVTLNYGYDEGTKALYFHSALKGLKTDFVTENPRVCATVIEDGIPAGDKCEYPYASVVLWGSMTIVQDFHEKKHAMQVMVTQLLKDPKPIMEGPLGIDSVYDNMAVWRLNIEDITGKRGK